MSRAFDILLVEDSAADAYLTRTVIDDGGMPAQLSIVKDGVEAMAYLRREAPHVAANQPDLILLDLNLPRMSGRELLVQIRADDAHRLIPVIVFTTSDRTEDVESSYALGANCYITKPVRLADSGLPCTLSSPSGSRPSGFHFPRQKCGSRRSRHRASGGMIHDRVISLEARPSRSRH